MGRIVINQTDAKQVVILSSDDAAIQGGYYDANGEWHKPGAGEWTTEGLIEGTEPSGDVVYEGQGPIRTGCFACNTAITSFYAPNASIIGGSAFESASNIKKIYIGGVYKGTSSQVGGYAIRWCSSLEELRIPKSNDRLAFGGYGFNGCTSLKLVELGEHNNNLNFSYLPTDTPLEILIIRGDTVHTATNDALNGSSYFKQGGLGGKLYVPQALIETYKTTSGWSTFYGYGTMEILPIEGSEYEL